MDAAVDERISCWSVLGYHLSKGLIIVMDALVDERISCWSVLKKQYKEVECVAVKNNKVKFKYIML